MPKVKSKNILKNISFIVPAHNEAFEIGRTVESIFSAARSLRVPFEVVVVNDASTDETAAIARAAGARVVDVALRKISAVRNGGARAATGDVFIFVDADTQISEPVVRSVWEILQKGVVGGGADVTFAEPTTMWARVALFGFGLIYGRLLCWAAGCFIFAERKAFEAVGGFDETLYVSEEIALSIALKKRGPFVIVRETVRTSSRKLRLYSMRDILSFLFRFARQGPAMLRQKSGLDWWYEGKREG